MQTNDGKYLIDYVSVVAFVDNNGTITLGEDWDYGTRTKTKVARFLGITTKTLNQQIKDGTTLVDTNLGDNV